MMPWGTDQTWVVPVEFDEPAGGLLFNNCLADSSCAALYEDALGGVQSVAPDLEFDTKAICTAELLAPWQGLEDPNRREYDAEEIEEGVADARAFISLRQGELADWLGTEAPEVPSGDEPCPDEGEEESPPLPPTPTPERPVVGPPPPSVELPQLLVSLRLRGVTVEGRWLKARVSVPGAGRLKLTAKTPGKNGATVCSARKKIEVAATTLLSCKLSSAALRTLEEGPLKLNVKVGLQAATPVDPASRTVTIPGPQ